MLQNKITALNEQCYANASDTSDTSRSPSKQGREPSSPLSPPQDPGVGKTPLVTPQPGCHKSGTWVLSPGALFYPLREDVRPTGRETPPGSCCRALMTPKMRPGLGAGCPGEEQPSPGCASRGVGLSLVWAPGFSDRAEEAGAHPASPLSYLV